MWSERRSPKTRDGRLSTTSSSLRAEVQPRVFQTFERLCAARGAGGAVLEIGAVPAPNTLLCLEAIRGATAKIGVNLSEPSHYADFDILQANANAMSGFEDGRFDTVLCNAVLEHDKFFWQTLAEIRRVTKPGGLVVIGVPGYTGPPQRRSAVRPRTARALARLGLGRLNWLWWSTLTAGIHNAPGDFYRFSPQAVQAVFFQDMTDVEIVSVTIPPVIIGAGRTPGHRRA